MKKPTGNIHPMRDLENRLLFSDPKNERALISLINATLGLKVKEAKVLDGKTIRSREKIKNEETQTVLFFREVDVLAVLEDESKVIIEFQIDRQKNYSKRALLYVIYRFAQQLEFLAENQLSTLDSIYPVYIVSILDHVHFQEHREVVSTYRISNEKHLTPLLDEAGREMIKLVFVELPKHGEGAEKLNPLLNDWCRHFTNQELPDEADEDVRFAQQLLASYKQNKEVQAMIEMSKLREIATRDEGREEGRKEGRKEGREEGRLEGLEKGMKETQKKIAINLLQSDMPLDQIEKITGLGLEQLRELDEK